MDKQAIVNFLGCLGVQPSGTIDGGKWIRCQCPLAFWTHDKGKDSNPSFAIKIEDDGKSTFNCFTCEHGYLSDLLTLFRSYGVKPPKYRLAEAYELLALEDIGGTEVKVKDWGEEDEEEKVVPWPEDFLKGFQPVIKVPRAVKYLESREVDVKFALDHGLVYDLKMDTVCFPIRDWHGHLVGLRGRHIDKVEAGKPYHMYKYQYGHNKLPWLGEHIVDMDKPVLLVESVFDWASCMRVYTNVLAPLTVGMNERKVKRIATATEIVTLFDQGVGGEKARDKVQYGLGTYCMITHVIPPAKDPGEMSRDQLIETLSSFLNLG